jgi:hypothetical protein
MTLLGTIQHLCASGLGLMLCSPEAVEELAPGSNTMPAGEDLREPLRSLVRSRRVVFLVTGSPQLYYDLEVHDEPPPATGSAARCRFGLRIDGGALWVRDGYDPTKWEAMPETLVPVPVRDGDYAVEACWIRSENEEDEKDGVMRVTLHFIAGPMPPVGEAWPELLYKAV